MHRQIAASAEYTTLCSKKSDAKIQITITTAHLNIYAVDFVKICKVCTKGAVIKAAKRIYNSDKICRNYCDFYFGVTFFGTQCILQV